MWSRTLLVSTLLVVSCARHKNASTAESDYAPSDSCRACHAAIADRFASDATPSTSEDRCLAKGP